MRKIQEQQLLIKITIHCSTSMDTQLRIPHMENPIMVPVFQTHPRTASPIIHKEWSSSEALLAQAQFSRLAFQSGQILVTVGRKYELGFGVSSLIVTIQSNPTQFISFQFQTDQPVQINPSTDASSQVGIYSSIHPSIHPHTIIQQHNFNSNNAFIAVMKKQQMIQRVQMYKSSPVHPQIDCLDTQDRFTCDEILYSYSPLYILLSSYLILSPLILIVIAYPLYSPLLSFYLSSHLLIYPHDHDHHHHHHHHQSQPNSI